MKIILILLTAVFLLSCNTGKNTELPDEPFLLILPEEFNETDDVPKAPRSAPFSRGVNFSGWFETLSAQRIVFTQYTEDDFANVKSLGADVIRLPARLNDFTNGAPSYTLDPLFLRFLDAAVDWAEKYELYLIIDNHTFHPVNATPDNVDEVLIPVWSQIAERYKDRSKYIVYEILNEPHGISDERWGEIQGRAIQAIRRHDQNRYIIVGGTGYNSIDKLYTLPHYDDDKLIYTFHFYDPYIFTHQGETWGGVPNLSTLAGVPFPYDRSRMPRIPANLRGTWVEGALNNDYRRVSSPNALYSTLNKAVAFALERDVPIFCGEFGVLMLNADPHDRALWYKFISDALDRRNISRTSWDYYGGFGIFNTPNRGDFSYDVNVNVLRAMGFTAPPQRERIIEPLSESFIIFDDHPGSMVSSGFWGDDDAILSFYEPLSAYGDFAIRWENAGRYNAFWFAFRNGDFSYLAESDFSLEFLARTDKPVKFDVRLLNAESETSIPWRMRYTVDEFVLPPDGNWHTINIPLSAMIEQGAWVNRTQTWHNPRGEFSWSNVATLEFASEHGELKNIWILFDNIKITN